MVPSLQNSGLLPSPCVLRGDSGGKVNILRGDCVSVCEDKVRMNMCLVPSGY
jgi:hypothetical protein